MMAIQRGEVTAAGEVKGVAILRVRTFRAGQVMSMVLRVVTAVEVVRGTGLVEDKGEVMGDMAMNWSEQNGYFRNHDVFMDGGCGEGASSKDGRSGGFLHLMLLTSDMFQTKSGDITIAKGDCSDVGYSYKV